MDVPYDQPFTGYGAPGAQPAAAQTGSFADEVRARVAKIHAQPTAGVTAPPAPLTGATPGRFPVPSWLKTAGGFGARVLGPIGAAAALTPIVQGAFEGGAELAANKGSSMAPDPAKLAAGAAMAPAAAPPAEVPTVGDDQVTMGQKNLATAMSPRFAQPASPDNTAMPPTGTGFITNNQTGKTTYIDSRGRGAVAARDFTGGNAAASFFQAGAHIKNIANDNALHMQGAKLLIDQMTKGATANKENAQAGNYGVRTQAAIAHLQANPGDYAGAGAVAAGRVPAAKNVFLPTMSADKVDVGNTGTGKISRVTVPASITMAEAVASAKKNGSYKTDAQVRADIQKMPGYRLTD